MAAMRPSEVAALEWRDVENAGDGMSTTIRNKSGEPSDVRFLKDSGALAIRQLRGVVPRAPTARVVPLGSRWIGRRLTIGARAAGIDVHLTGQSGRAGLALELLARGATMQEVMVAGGCRCRCRYP